MRMAANNPKQIPHVIHRWIHGGMEIIGMQDSRAPCDSILDAVFIVSPKRQYLGIVKPTTPLTIGPVWIPAFDNMKIKYWSLPKGRSLELTNPDLQAEVRFAWQFVAENTTHDIQGAVGHFNNVTITVSHWKTTDQHIHIHHSLYLWGSSVWPLGSVIPISGWDTHLVDIMLTNCFIKQDVNSIQKFNHLRQNRLQL